VTAVQQETGALGATALDVVLERDLPAALPVGRATAVFLFGTCFHRHRRVADLEITVNGARHRPTAQRMPRLDRFRALHPTLVPREGRAVESDPQSARDPELRCYRSGFWATIPIGPLDAPGELELRLEARLADGTTASAIVGTIPVVEPPAAPSHKSLSTTGARPLIAICMATYNPDLELFRTQVESIRAQTDRDWVCFVSDDCSAAESFDAITAIIGDDERFVLSRSERRLNFYRNFERALGMVPPEVELIALSDHDDRWYPDKLEVLREAIGSAELAYSDVRRVDADGNVRAETLWEGRSNNCTNLASLLVSNTIVGASCLFRRKVLERALPFPTGPSWNFHDHWLALVALASGDLVYVHRALYDYVQHPKAVLGHTASGLPRDAPSGLRASLARWRGFFGRWRSTYFNLYLHRELLAQDLLLRCSADLTSRKRRALRLMIAAGRSPLAFAWIAVRPARALLGHRETLLLEASFAKGILWRYLIVLCTLGRERPGRIQADASFPGFAPQHLGRMQKRWLARR